MPYEVKCQICHAKIKADLSERYRGGKYKVRETEPDMEAMKRDEMVRLKSLAIAHLMLKHKQDTNHKVGLARFTEPRWSEPS